MLKCLNRIIKIKIFNLNKNKMKILEIKNLKVGNNFFIQTLERMEYKEKLNALNNYIWFINLKRNQIKFY